MTKRAEISTFIRSKAGSSFLMFVLFCGVLSAGVGYGTYRLGLDGYVADKGEEKKTALQLVDAFVTNYSDIRGRFGSSDVPVPATFRAHSIDLFNRIRHADDVLRMVWVGRAGRAIATPPSDAAIAEIIEGFAREPHPEPRSSFLAGSNGPIFRTVYPSVATEQSCVDCHNRLQAGKPQWHLNDVMGAFAIDAPAGPFLRSDLLHSAGVALALFGALTAAGLLIAVLYFRRQKEREATFAAMHKAKEEAEQASRSKSEFLANMSHELRTPLNAVIGFAELMRSEAFGALGDRYLDYVTDIHRSGAHLLAIINDLLDLAKIDAGHMELHEEAIDLASVCRAAVMINQPRALEAQIEIDLSELPKGAAIWADERLIKQALLNLLSNAVKFSHKGGRVRLAVSDVTEGPVEISVADKGIGMRCEDIPRVLKPFIQVDGSLQRRYEGTGLGLPLTKSIVELHGGELVIDSALGVGTAVTIRLPASRRWAAGDTATGRIKQHGSKRAPELAAS